MKKVLLPIVAVVVAAALGLGAWTAFGAGDETWARSACGDRTAELSVEEDDGGLEVSFELQSTAPGEAWDVVLQQGDTSLLEGERQTDEDAELDVDAPAREDGSHEFAVTATPTDGGEPCTASLTR